MPRPLLPDRLEYLLRDRGQTMQRVAGGAALLEIGDPSGPPTITGLGLSTAVRRNAQGQDVAEVGAAWDPVPAPTGESADVQRAQVRDYLVSYSTNGGQSYNAAQSTQATAATIHNLPVGIVVHVRVSARTTQGVVGPAATASITTAKDATAPGIPSTPTTEGVLKGVRVRWDGLTATGAAMPSDLRWLEVTASTTVAGATDPASIVGTMAPGDRVYTYPTPDYATYYFALRAVDHAGNKSGWSGVASGKGSQAVSDDLAETIKVNAAAYGTFGGGNGVANSGFEAKTESRAPDPFRSWTRVTSASAVGDGYKRSATAARLNRSSGQAAYLETNTIPVSETGGCVASAWVRLNAADLTPRVEVFAVDGGSAPVVKPAGEQPIPPIDPAAVGVWQRLAVAYSSKRRADVRVRVALDSGPNGTVDVDAVQYEEGDYLTAYAPMPAEITPGSIGRTEIGPDAISSEKIIAGAVVAGKVQADAIGAREIRAGSITAANAHLEDAVVVRAKIRDLAVDTAKIGDLAVTSAKVAEVTAERITTGVLRSTTRIIAGDPNGNRVEIDYDGIRLISRASGVDVVTVNLDRASGSGRFTGAITGSTITGSTLRTGDPGQDAIILSTGGRDTVRFEKASLGLVGEVIGTTQRGISVRGVDVANLFAPVVSIGQFGGDVRMEAEFRVNMASGYRRMGIVQAATNSNGTVDIAYPQGPMPYTPGTVMANIRFTGSPGSSGPGRGALFVNTGDYSPGAFRLYGHRASDGQPVSTTRVWHYAAECVRG